MCDKSGSNWKSNAPLHSHEAEDARTPLDSLITSRNRYRICCLRMMVSSRSCAPQDLLI